MSRPTSITVIAWLMIVFGGLSLVSFVFTMGMPEVQKVMAQSPLPISVQYAMAFTGVGVTIVCGAGFLSGQNWSRFLYVVWSAIGVVVGFLTSPSVVMMIPSLLFMALVIFFLFRPAANQFFASA